VSLEYLNKLMILIGNYNKQNKDFIKIDLAEIFQNILETEESLKIIKRAYKILVELGFSVYFF